MCNASETIGEYVLSERELISLLLDGHRVYGLRSTTNLEEIV